MCLIVFSFNSNPRFKLILAANRDEFYDRPTKNAHYWEDYPQILAGQDLVQGGAWLGVSRSGHFAAVTNYRDPGQPKGKISRGNLVKDFLVENRTIPEYLEEIKNNQHMFSGFNLLLGIFGGRKNEMAYFSNREGKIKFLSSGIYGLSNSLLNTPWQKVHRGKSRLEKITAEMNVGNKFERNSLFSLLEDKTKAADKDLPNTGIGLEYERILSPIFIKTPVYGTRSSTVLTIGQDNNLGFNERNHFPDRSIFSENFLLPE